LTNCFSTKKYSLNFQPNALQTQQQQFDPSAVAVAAHQQQQQLIALFQQCKWLLSSSSSNKPMASHLGNMRQLQRRRQQMAMGMEEIPLVIYSSPRVISRSILNPHIITVILALFVVYLSFYNK
jgi:hypothetical protein